MFRRALLDPLLGRTPLWRIVWIYGFAILILGNLLAFTIPSELSAMRAFRLGAFVVTSLWSLALWRCSYNCEAPLLGHMARALAVAVFLSGVALITFAVVENAWAAT
jgi:hypothetical protein